MAFGEQSPDEYTDVAMTWQDWDTTGYVDGNLDWGKMHLESGQEATSQVYGFGNETLKRLEILTNNYGEGDTPGIQKPP